MVDWTAAVVVMLVGIISVFMVLGLLSIAVTVTGLLVNRATAFQKSKTKVHETQVKTKC